MSVLIAVSLVVFAVVLAAALLIVIKINWDSIEEFYHDVVLSHRIRFSKWTKSDIELIEFGSDESGRKEADYVVIRCGASMRVHVRGVMAARRYVGQVCTTIETYCDRLDRFPSDLEGDAFTSDKMRLNDYVIRNRHTSVAVSSDRFEQKCSRRFLKLQKIEKIWRICDANTASARRHA